MAGMETCDRPQDEKELKGSILDGVPTLEDPDRSTGMPTKLEDIRRRHEKAHSDKQVGLRSEWQRLSDPNALLEAQAEHARESESEADVPLNPGPVQGFSPDETIEALRSQVAELQDDRESLLAHLGDADSTIMENHAVIKKWKGLACDAQRDLRAEREASADRQTKHADDTIAFDDLKKKLDRARATINEQNTLKTQLSIAKGALVMAKQSAEGLRSDKNDMRATNYSQLQTINELQDALAEQEHEEPEMELEPEQPTICDRYYMAALTGLLGRPGADSLVPRVATAHARDMAEMSMARREEYTQRD